MRSFFFAIHSIGTAFIKGLCPGGVALCNGASASVDSCTGAADGISYVLVKVVDCLALASVKGSLINVRDKIPVPRAVAVKLYVTAAAVCQHNVNRINCCCHNCHSLECFIKIIIAPHRGLVNLSAANELALLGDFTAEVNTVCDYSRIPLSERKPSTWASSTPSTIRR